MKVKLSVVKESAHGRHCLITEWGTFENPIDLPTPAYLTYTTFGHIPHLTWDVVENELQLKQPQIYQITLASLFEALDAIKEMGEGVKKFCAMPKDAILHLSHHDPLGRIASGFNDSCSMAIWSGKAGRRSITPKLFADLMEVCKVHSFDSLHDYDTPSDSMPKRIGKSVARSSEWNSSLIPERPLRLNEAAFMPLGGGFSKEHRELFAKHFATQPFVGGFAFDLWPFSHGPLIDKKTEFDEAVIKDLIGDIMMAIPQDVPRFVAGAFDPTQIHFLTKLGIDLFDSSYAVLLAQTYKAFRVSDSYAKDGVFTIVDLQDEKYKDDMSRLYENCLCHTCTTFQKAYLQHLTVCREMLGMVLLVIHNMTEFDRMFEMLREHVAQ